MHRQHLLNELLECARPLNELREDLAKIPWDSLELVQLRPHHVDAQLMAFTSGQRDAESICEWANMIEGRDDIGFDPEKASLLRDLIDELSNPDLFQNLTLERALAMHSKLVR